ncbi:SDR family oxidoreductase [Sphingomonas sp. YL-JM2C]
MSDIETLEGMMAGDAKKAVVLGASVPGGTGWVTAGTLASRGFGLSVGARRIEPASRLAEEIGGDAFRCDATVEADIAAMAQAVAADGPIDVAVLAAGEGVTGNIDDIGDDAFDHALKLNYVSAVHFIRHMARHMAPGGSIVLMSSIAAARPWPGYFAYGCAKAALETLVRYAAIEYAPKGIRINAVCPGPIAAVPGAKPMPEALSTLIDSAMPLRRRVTPAEVAEAVAWLSVGATATTGEIVHLDGGMHLGRPPYPDEIKAALAR